MTPREYYEQHLADFQNVINSQHIMVKTEELAEELLQRLQKGEDFVKLVEKFTIDDETKQTGGLLGFHPNRLAVKPFDEAEHSLVNIGDICGPIKTEWGYHIIRLVGKKEVLTFEESEDFIELLMKKMEEKH